MLFDEIYTRPNSNNLEAQQYQYGVVANIDKWKMLRDMPEEL